MSDILDVVVGALGAGVTGGPQGLGTPTPSAGDPGVAPGDPTGGWLDWLSQLFGKPAPIPVYPPGDRRNAMVIAPDTPNLDPERGLPAAGEALGSIWADIKGGAPVVGVYGLLAALFLIGVASLFFASSPGQALTGGAAGEVNAIARQKGRSLIRPPKKE